MGDWVIGSKLSTAGGTRRKLKQWVMLVNTELIQVRKRVDGVERDGENSRFWKRKNNDKVSEERVSWGLHVNMY